MSESTLPIVTRLWFALACLLRVLFDGAFAARLFAARHAPRALAPAGDAADEPRVRRGGEAMRREEPKSAATSSGVGRPGRARARATDAGEAPEPAADRLVGPLQLLALLQREGRLVDFLEQDITSFEDADVGAAARVVHEGCRKALRACATIVPVRSEEEESGVTVEPGYDPAEVKLTGSVAGKPPYRGLLRHRGWRVRQLELPEPMPGHDFRVVAPAEIEIGADGRPTDGPSRATSKEPR